MNGLTVFRIIMAFAIGFGTASVFKDADRHDAVRAPAVQQQPAG